MLESRGECGVGGEDGVDVGVGHFQLDAVGDGDAFVLVLDVPAVEGVLFAEEEGLVVVGGGHDVGAAAFDAEEVLGEVVIMRACAGDVEGFGVAGGRVDWVGEAVGREDDEEYKGKCFGHRRETVTWHESRVNIKLYNSFRI